MRRAMTISVLLSTLALGGPVLGFLLWVSTVHPDWLLAWVNRPVAQRTLDIVAFFVVVVLLGVATSITIGRRAGQQVVAAIGELAQDAERLGTGEPSLRQMSSGIDEIDRVSAVLSRSAGQLARALATERGFASDASHQLRTPLTALLMRIEEIAATDDLDVVHEEARVAIAQVERLSRVVDELLQRRRADPQAGLPEVSLDSVIAALQREWQPAFETARRSVHVHGERGLMVRATPVALSQVLSTLLENSLVHGRGTVDVQARRSGPSVVVEVRDEGEGISAALAPHVFERAVSSGDGGGSGLGLALARDLAVSCGGRLDLVSRHPATFALFLSEAPGPRA